MANVRKRKMAENYGRERRREKEKKDSADEAANGLAARLSLPRRLQTDRHAGSRRGRCQQRRSAAHASLAVVRVARPTKSAEHFVPPIRCLLAEASARWLSLQQQNINGFSRFHC